MQTLSEQVFFCVKAIGFRENSLAFSVPCSDRRLRDSLPSTFQKSKILVNTTKMMKLEATMVFRIFFLLTFFTFLFSCSEKSEPKVPAPTIAKRRLFDIKSIRYIIPNNSFEYYDKGSAPFIEVRLKNVSNFDLNVYYEKSSHFRVWAYDEYINYPTTGTPIFDFVDTSRLIKQNEEFIAPLLSWISLAQFYAYEFQGVKFQILISSPNDLSFYFEDNPNKPWFKISEGNDNVKKYAYPFQFTYWVTNDIFWEDHLLEHPPRFYWQNSTDDK